jgi:acyl-CoA dehydrogenase
MPSRSVYDADHEHFRDSVRKFLAAEVVPNLDAWRAAGRFPARVVRAAGGQGFLGTAVPEEFGGGGVDDQRFTAVLVEETMAVGAAGLAAVFAQHSGVCIPALLRSPDTGRRAAWLSGLAAGELLGVPVITAGTGAAGVPGAAVADLFVVAAPRPMDTLAVLPRAAVRVDPVVGALGGREAAAADVVLDPGEAPRCAAAAELLCDFDLWWAVLGGAGARAALELTVTYVQERTVFGRPVASFENTRFRLAEVAAHIAAVQALTDSCLGALAAGGLTPAAAAGARLVASAVYDRAVDQGMQLHGGYGYMREYPISHAFADARFLRLAAAATSEPREALAAALGLSDPNSGGTGAP